MGRGSVGEAGSWAVDVMQAVSALRQATGLTNQELIERSGMSATYYYARMRGAAPFDMNDIEKLARALGTHPHEISRVAASTSGVEEFEPKVSTDPHELARRLSAIAHAPGLDGSAFEVGTLIAYLAERGVLLRSPEWAALVAGAAGVAVRLRVLEGVADYAGIAPAYLVDLSDDEAVEAVEANLEFREALKVSGADSISARAVGEVSPTALRAIAKSLRSIAAQ